MNNEGRGYRTVGPDGSDAADAHGRARRLLPLPAVVRRTASFPARRVGWKIMAPYLLLTAFFAVLGTFLVTRLVTGSLEERFSNQLVEASRVASDSVVRQERRQLEAVRAISFANGVPMATDSRDAAALETLVLPFAANGRVEQVEVLDVRGQRIFGAELASAEGLRYQPLNLAADRSGWPMVARLLAQQRDQHGDKFAGMVYDGKEWAFYTAAPIEEGGRLTGVVLVGTKLSSFLATAKSEALADLTFYAPDYSFLATTFVDHAESVAALAPKSGPRSSDAGPWRERSEVFGREYELLYSDLRVRGEPAGYYSVALPTSYIASAGSTARTQMAVLFAAITIAVVFLGWVLAKALTDPLHRLVATTRTVTEGDLTVRTGIRRSDEIGDLAFSFDVMTEKLQRQHLATIGALASAIDARDPYTAGHSMRVGQLAAELGSALGLPVSQLQHLEIGGYLHDIGKIGVRDSVLLKAGSLEPAERELIEQHPRIGLEILRRVELSPEVIAFVGGHHEKLDGSGYPLGLKGDEITIFPRIASVADIYDAVTSDRPYRKGMTVEEALALLEREADAGQIDREVLNTLRALAPSWEKRREDDPMLAGYRLTDGIFRKVA